MTQDTIIQVIIAYAALVVALYAHELGHFPKKIVINRWFPIPLLTAVKAGHKLGSYFPGQEIIERYGGIAVNLLIAFLVMKYNPANQFILLVGAFSFIHFIMYTSLGCFNQETGYVKGVKTIVYDDVPNGLKYIFLPISAVALIWLGPFYWNIIWPIPLIFTVVWIFESKLRELYWKYVR